MGEKVIVLFFIMKILLVYAVNDKQIKYMKFFQCTSHRKEDIQGSSILNLPNVRNLHFGICSK